MSFFIESGTAKRWVAETVEFALSSACCSAVFGFLLREIKIIQLSDPLHGGAIYGAVAAVAVAILNEMIDLDDEGQKYFGAGVAVVVATGAVVSAGYPISFISGAALLPSGVSALLGGGCLLPAVMLAKRVADVYREWGQERYDHNCT